MHKKTVQPTFVCKISKTSVWVLIISACFLHPDDAIVSFRLFKLFLHNCSLFLGCFGCYIGYYGSYIGNFGCYIGSFRPLGVGGRLVKQKQICYIGRSSSNHVKWPKTTQNPKSKEKFA